MWVVICSYKDKYETNVLSICEFYSNYARVVVYSRMPSTYSRYNCLCSEVFQVLQRGTNKIY